MSETDINLTTTINYYLREKYYQTAEELCQEGLRKFVNDPALEFYTAISLLQTDRIQEALRQLESINDHPEVSLGAIQASIHAHKACKTVDKEAVQTLESQLRDEYKNANDRSNYFGAVFAFHMGKHEKAKEFIDKSLKKSPSNAEYICLKGWIELYVGRDMKAAVKIFEDVLELPGAKNYPDAYLGKAKYLELRSNFGGILETLNQAMVHMQSFLPIQLEKMKSQLMLKEWDQSYETAQRCQIINHRCIEGLKYTILFNVCYEGQFSEAASQLGDFIQELDRSEPHNPELYLAAAKLFARVCGRYALILQQTRTMCERAVSIDKNRAEIQAELGDQYRLAGNNKMALKTFKSALDMQDGSNSVLIGIVRCQIVENEISEAEAQIDFMKEVQKDVAKSYEIKYLEAQIALRKKRPKTEVLSLFATAVEEHFAEAQKLPFGPTYFIALNPDQLLQVVGDVYTFSPVEPMPAGQTSDPSLKLIIRILNVLTDACPALSDASYLMGKAKYLSGDTESAEKILQLCLSKDQTCSEAHILMAQIYLLQGNFKQASHSLEVGLSFNFEVRENPLYHLIKARIQKRSKDITGAVQTLETTMSLPGFRKTATAAKDSKKGGKLDLTPSDRALIYLELIDCFQAQGKTEHAEKLMLEAQSEFEGTKEEQRLLISNADLAIARGDTDRAITLLKNVTSDQPHFLQARQKMADIYLHHKKDKRLFATCFRELVEKSPTPQTYIMLGDAYMSIQEPDRAIEVYETAMKKNPKDHDLARKIGQAYVRSHNFTKAVNYYEASLKSGQENFLRYDLAELLLKLKNYEKCEKVLRMGLEKQTGSPNDVQSLQEEVKFLELLARLHSQTNKSDQAAVTLNQAKEQQAKVVKRGVVELGDSLDEQKKLASKICCQLAQFYQNHRDFEKAINLYREALAYDETDLKIMQSLAHLHMLTGDLEACNQRCMLILKLDKDNDQATLNIADIMYQKNQSEAAMFHFQQLLERNPNQYGALARVIELFWRTGELEQAEKYIKLAEQSNSRAVFDAGFNYAKGLYEWYTGDPNAALQHFNKARRDPEWGARSIYNMIEICLNPDNEIVGGEVFEQGEAVDNTTSSDKQDAHENGVRTAEKLLKEVRTRPGNDYKNNLTENFILIATKNRSNVETAISSFTEMAGVENEEAFNVGAILGLAQGFMILKQTPKAKQHLKKVLGRPWTFEDADHLEQCWLLLADTYINQNKYDVAVEILKTCLQHNASCMKAYEYMGFIKEKETKWAEAATSYEQAWKLSRQRNPTIGYKLGFNYMKAKRYLDAIDVCHRVLELFPNYPKIRKDILEKARSNIRI